MKKKFFEKMVIPGNPKTRSVFANVKMTGAGAHKSAKDYDRKSLKREMREVFKGFN